MVTLVNTPNEANCITHNGTMHADEVFATAFLDFYLGDVRLLRTSSVAVSQEDVLVYDIGRGKFDHHQLDAEKRENGITYSSFGLLWKEYGRDFLTKKGFSNVEDVFLGIDKDLVEGIDADDNGFFPKIEANYKVKTLPNIIKIFNPSFDSNQNEKDQFLKAVSLAKIILEEELYYINGKVLSDQKVFTLLEKHPSDQKFLILDEYLPYEEALLTNELGQNILFVAFPSNRGGYVIKAVPKSVEDRSLRLAFPSEWAGLQNEELERVSGISGLRFCHTACFIVNCKDLDVVFQVLALLCQ